MWDDHDLDAIRGPGDDIGAVRVGPLPLRDGRPETGRIEAR